MVPRTSTVLNRSIHHTTQHHHRDSTSPTSIHSADQLDISEAAQLISQARDAAPIRLDRVADIRAQIADGTYDTTDKLDLAVDRLLNELG